MCVCVFIYFPKINKQTKQKRTTKQRSSTDGGISGCFTIHLY